MIIFPTIAWLAGTALTIFILFIRTRGMLEVGVPTKASAPILAAQWGTTIAVNIYATAAIVYRIYRAEEESNASALHSGAGSLLTARRTPLQRTMRILIESGLFYTVVSISAFVSVVAKSNVIFITSGMDIVVVGITFNQIIVRLSEERARERIEATLRSRLGTLRFGHPGEFHETVEIADYVNRFHDLPGIGTIEKHTEGENFSSSNDTV